MTRVRIGSWKYRVPVIFRATPLWYFDRRFSDALLPLINELMGTDGIRFCPDWFWLQFQENVRAKIVPDILFFFFSINLLHHNKGRAFLLHRYSFQSSRFNNSSNILKINRKILFHIDAFYLLYIASYLIVSADS